MSTLYVDTINEKTSGNGVQIADLVPAAGSVVQVVNTTSTTATEVDSSTTWTTVAGSITITPTASTSKVLIMHNAGGMAYANPEGIGFRLLRDGTVITTHPRYGFKAAPDGTWNSVPFTMIYLDSPSTTSAVTYTFQVNATGTNGQWRHNDSSGVSGTATSIAQEIAQ